MRNDVGPQSWGSRARAMPLVVSFFSGQFYAREAWELMRTCQAFNLDYEIVELPDEGDWLTNVNRKPKFIFDMSLANPRRSLLWLDADARVRRYPELFRGIGCPIAYHRIDGSFPCDATVYLGRDRGQREEFLGEWIRLLEDDPTGAKLPPELAAVGAPAQYYFERAILNTGLSPTLLPEDYCWLFDLSKDRQGKGLFPDRVPVIEQMQANRWAKKLAGAK